MKRFLVCISSLFIFSFLSLNLSAQYGPQFDNRGFEQWTNRANEPSHWHSGGTADGSYSSFLPDDLILSSTQIRPGSTGTKSVRLVPREVGFMFWTYTANGNLTNGRMNAGSSSTTGEENYNGTRRNESGYNTPISQLPDSLSIWVCFRSQSSTQNAQVKAVVHGNADYQIRANGTETPSNMHVATAEQAFTRTSANGGAYNWRRLSIPFQNTGPCTDVRYILFTATTNVVPGEGSTNDDMFVDDVLLIYNPTLNLSQLAANSYSPGDAITIPFTLTGTMSPENLNASANQVIAQLSDASGSFSDPTELGRVTTNSSGSITATIPNVSAGNGYRIRVISTNYPMVGGNIQEISIAPNAFTITATADPAAGGSVTGDGSYDNGETCTLIATANTGYTFVNWTKNGTQVSTNATYSFTVTESAAFVAHFSANSYTINVTANPNDGGTVTGGGTYTFGQSCTVHATAATGYNFVNWRENGNHVTSQPEYTFTVTSDRDLEARFGVQSFEITATADPANGGNVTGGGNYQYGSTCNLTATAHTGYTFVNWTKNGTQVSTNATYSFTVTESAAYVAHFSINSYLISVTADPSEGGIVSGAGNYDYGSTCTLTATANENYIFVNWTKNGAQVSTLANYTFTVTGAETYVAHFQSTNSIEDNRANNQIFPNPFTSMVCVQAEKTIKNVRVYDINGRFVKEQDVFDKQFDLDLSGLSAGTYLLQIDYGDSQSLHRIMKAE